MFKSLFSVSAVFVLFQRNHDILVISPAVNRNVES